jgi:hypothetical protein
MRGHTVEQGERRNLKSRRTGPGDPSSVSLREPPSPARGEGSRRPAERFGLRTRRLHFVTPQGPARISPPSTRPGRPIPYDGLVPSRGRAQGLAILLRRECVERGGRRLRRSSALASSVAFHPSRGSERCGARGSDGAGSDRIKGPVSDTGPFRGRTRKASAFPPGAWQRQGVKSAGDSWRHEPYSTRKTMRAERLTFAETVIATPHSGREPGRSAGPSQPQRSRA